MDGYIRSVSGQRLSKHVPAETVTHAMGETVCCLRGPRRGVIKKRIEATSSVLESWRNDLSTEVEESPLLEAVARERLVKALQAGEDLVFAVVICKV
jgi:hypothetical protein